jgi:sigma-B regulation protein RsbU (phosphoserine phosphatase)
MMLVTPQPDAPLQTLIRQADLSKSGAKYKVGTHISGWVLKYHQPLVIENLASDTRFHVSPEEARDIRTIIAVPVLIRGAVIGILIMTNKKHNEVFTKDDLRLLTIIAAQSAQLIRNSQLQTEALEKKRLEYELDLAHGIQQQLLPEADPDTKYLDIAGFFRPHRSVSGDYYDYIALPDERYAIVIADVSGHGPPAALVMTLIKGIVHSVIQEYKSPDKILTRVNRIVCKIIPPEMFVTMLCLIFDPGKNELHFANAGHAPLIAINHKGSKPDIYPANDCPLNVIADVNYHSQVLHFSQDDFFLTYTDGLSEAINHNKEMLGVDRLADILLSIKRINSQQTLNYLLQLLKEQQYDLTMSDDIVIVVIRIKEHLKEENS